METVKITRLRNGFVLDADTLKTPDSHVYCANLKGVVSELYRAFEGMTKMSRQQVESSLDFLKQLVPGSKPAKK